jgi:hypothetical protein
MSANVVVYAIFARHLPHGLRIYTTPEIHIGVGIHMLSVGDVVAIIYGSRVRFLLRPLDLARCTYRLIGETWVEGIMNGEFIEGNPPTDGFPL